MLQSARGGRKVHLTQGSQIAAPQEICAMVWLCLLGLLQHYRHFSDVTELADPLNPL